MTLQDLQPNFDVNGLIPAIIQDARTKNVLMLGYMNQEALEQTLDKKVVTFYSRSKQRLWTKGETSDNFLQLHAITNDCDSDALLVEVHPQGPTCHTGADTCWQSENKMQYGFLSELEHVINSRFETPSEGSYVSSLIKKGINKIAQKVGEEAVEVVIEAKDSNDELFLDESADLLFHYLILLRAKGYNLNDVVQVLEKRN
jgi:phosphoribosyl-AMP cyclohydrolase / phosphoribosyl-ATP pyrophosphohydrolase